MKRSMTFAQFALVLLCFARFDFASVPEPRKVLGFTPGDDRKLANWESILSYFHALDSASGRIQVRTIGQSTEGRPFVYALISSPNNLEQLDRYVKMNDELADPRKIGRLDLEATKRVKAGKTFVLITHGVHSTEVGSSLSSILLAYQLASSSDERIRKILDETIIIMVPSLNPDGVDIVKNWYDKTLGTKFEGTAPPELYHKYVGHDLNRDWYAFTQIETKLMVKYVHNVYHPQIVHDIHQQGANGARYFVPPYLPPVEPNVPKEIVEGYSKLGSYVASKMRGDGFQGITTDSTYDAWTPARAYSHYHGGVRILSETASAKLATPIDVKFDELGGSIGYDARIQSANFSPVWRGGRWTVRDVTNYMVAGAMHLLDHAAANRKEWLTRFYSIGKEATRPRKKKELNAIAFNELSSLDQLPESVLEVAGLEVRRNVRIGFGTRKSEQFEGSIVEMAQPYSSFARAILLPQKYPDLKDAKGVPIPPYDVTANSIALLHGFQSIPIFQSYRLIEKESKAAQVILRCDSYNEESPRKIRRVYNSSVPSMDRGWLMWVINQDANSISKCKGFYADINDKQIRESIPQDTATIVFSDQSASQIFGGFKEGTMPAEFTGGLRIEGLKKLKAFVENGGRLVFLNRASNFALKYFDLPIVDLTDGYSRKDFFIPGTILRTELDETHPISVGLMRESIAWFENSPVFEVKDNKRVRVIARYPFDTKKILLSGWAHGVEKIAGKAALLEVSFGKGSIVLFGFRPHYRGQSRTTFELLNRATDSKTTEFGNNSVPKTKN